MKIAIDLTPCNDHLTGIERYNINIAKNLIMNHRDDTYILIFKERVLDDFKDIITFDRVDHKILKPCSKFYFIQVRLLSALKKIDADYYLFLSFTSPFFFRRKRTINAIHDLSCWDCPESMPYKMVLYYRLAFYIAVRSSWKVITVSEFSRGRICDRFGLSSDDVSVIYDGLTDIFNERTGEGIDIAGKYGLPDRYILSLSTIEPRKNLQLLIRAYRELASEGISLPYLVLAGRKGWMLDEIVGGMDDWLKERVIFTGFVDDSDLPQLYERSEFFVFPSKYEGFGIPIIEAMSQKTLVIGSDAASLPEIIGDGGIIFESNNLSGLKEAIRTAMNMDVYEKEKIVEAGYQRSIKFSWAKEAEKLYSIMYEK